MELQFVLLKEKYSYLHACMNTPLPAYKYVHVNGYACTHTHTCILNKPDREELIVYQGSTDTPDNTQ
jgi:hypothetical protein